MQYRLPDGEHTDNQELYIDMWRSLGERVAHQLSVYQPESVKPRENWRLSGFDPDIQLVSENRVLTLPVDVAHTIAVAIDGGYHKLHDYFWDKPDRA